MENLIIIYSLKASVALCLLYGFYFIFLRKDTFFALKRIYFLFSIVISLVFPFIILDFSQFYQPTETVRNIVNQITLSPVIITNGTQTESTIGWQQFVLSILLLTSIILFVRLLTQCVSIIYIISKHKHLELALNTKIVSIEDKEIAPFSFFKWICLNPKLHTDSELSDIIKHEKVHAKQYHSIDVLIVEILCALFWWNPIVWLLRKEMRMNLEYIVDNNILMDGIDVKVYQYHLVKLSFGKTTAVVNNFNVSQLKKRITMMNKERTIKQKVVKYLLLLPFVGMLITANCLFASCSNNANKENQEAVNSLQSSEPKVTIGVSTLAETTEESQSQKDEVFTSVEEMPQYPGGMNEMMKFIGENLKYPDEAVKNKIQGRVIIKFVVSKTGKITDVNVLRGFNAACDAEAIRVVKAMPDWTPGKQKGEPVPVYFTLPIQFSLQK